MSDQDDTAATETAGASEEHVDESTEHVDESTEHVDESTETDHTSEGQGGSHADASGEHSHGHEHGAETGAYDPENVSLPSREPPRRSTAPQSDFTMGQVLFGTIVLLVGVALVFGVPLAMT